MSIHRSLLAALALGSLAVAQEIEFPAASPPSLVRNQVGLTTVEIEYSRPGVKGRTIFGGLVPYGDVWRTGANAATRVTFSTDVRFGGEPLPAGTYALFTIPGRETWTVILNANPDQWGSYGHDPSQDVLRVDVPAETLAAPVETMRLGVDHIRDDGAQLTFAWETTGFRVPIEIDLVSQLRPRIEAVMADPGDDAPYLAAAMFYYEHDLDLGQALDWIDAALELQPEAVWILYRKGLVQAELGDVDGARASAEKARAIALARGGELGDEYRRLSEALLAELGES